MSDSLDFSLEQISQSSNSISTLYFKPPGIFHNAIVHEPRTSYADVITKIIRDGDPQDEVSLYKIDSSGLPKRKDGRKGVFDYLTELEINLKRNRRLGIQDENTIIQVPKEFYLKQHAQEAKKRKKNTGYILEDTQTGGVFDVLLKKFESDPRSQQLLKALQNGSVITNEHGDDATSRRKTMFVEDFPVEQILKVLNEVVTEWPVGEYQKRYAELLKNYNEINSEIQQLRSQIEVQEAQLHGNQGASSVVKLIEKEQREIEKLEHQIRQVQN
ncbi:LAFE_0B11628g1_1 [Lachancea fermentati]|uniref:DASH complex subunit SPC34 n=1 Tax=Lachancea fermentati TaxID=4955 RepID=A0A1G4M913_LACFM|nr:LAFE_0B11628g1_1 [Lachancea fermentati]